MEAVTVWSGQNRLKSIPNMADLLFSQQSQPGEQIFLSLRQLDVLQNGTWFSREIGIYLLLIIPKRVHPEQEAA